MSKRSLAIIFCFAILVFFIFSPPATALSREEILNRFLEHPDPLPDIVVTPTPESTARDQYWLTCPPEQPVGELHACFCRCLTYRNVETAEIVNSERIDPHTGSPYPMGIDDLGRTILVREGCQATWADDESRHESPALVLPTVTITTLPTRVISTMPVTPFVTITPFQTRSRPTFPVTVPVTVTPTFTMPSTGLPTLYPTVDITGFLHRAGLLSRFR